MLKSIESDSIHRICSSQVVSSLAIAVKELTENAIDAGATKLDIKLISSGLSLSVSDNGNGIKEEDHSSVAVKHATSKISGFKDLESVGSYGFRGEALSSLAFLSNLEITTRTADDDIGWLLKYDKEGKLHSSSREAREVGTTVSLGELFNALPVRYREYKKNIKREYKRLLSLIQAYAVVCENIKISVTNKGKTVLRTHGKGLINNIGSIFGWKQVETIKKLDFEFDGVAIKGYLSDPKQFGERTSERQMFFMKSRPVDLPKLKRLINHAFRARCPKRSPFVVLNIDLPEGTFDINLTPDKRTIFIHNETEILEEIKKHVNKIWDADQQSYEVSQCGKQMSLDQSWLDTSSQTLAYNTQEVTPPSEKEPSSFLINQLSPVKPTVDSPAFSSKRKSLSNFSSPNSRLEWFRSSKIGQISSSRKRVKLNFSSEFDTAEAEGVDRSVSQVNLLNCQINDSNEISPAEPFGSQPTVTGPFGKTSYGPFGKTSSKISNTMTNSVAPSLSTFNLKETYISTESRLIGSVQPIQEKAYPQSADNSVPTSTTFQSPDIEQSNELLLNAASSALEKSNIQEDESMNMSLCSSVDKNGSEQDEQMEMEDIIEINRVSREKLDIQIPASMESIRARFTALYGSSKQNCPEARQDEGCGESGNILEVGKSLRRLFEKNSFKEMRIVGQFNLGFILATHGGDLFIIDQHATDEKFNFEMIKRTSSLTSQPMIKPIRLYIPREQELKVIENLDVFERNGFRIKVEADAEPCQQLLITSMPFVKGKTFSVDDVHELIALLNEEADPTTVLMPKAVALFAMKACRKSIMIGTALDKAKMRKVVDHMSGLDHPWNCPHGRPTMRHLYSVKSDQNLGRRGMNISWGNLIDSSK